MPQVALGSRLIVALFALLVWAAPADAQIEQPKPPPFPGTAAPAQAQQMPARATTAQKQAAPPAGLMGRLWLWVLEGQRELTSGMTAAVRQLKTGNAMASAAILAAISFFYGVLHAVGPGHGKFVISSYALATERTVRRGILLSFMAAFVQAMSAIAIVGVLAIALKSTSIQIRVTEAWLETASWGLIALLGAWLLIGQVRCLVPGRRSRSGAADAHPQGRHAAEGSHHHHHHHHHEHAADGSCCGHVHAPTLSQLEGQWSWPRAWSLALSIGVRPCTGAIGVLIFALGIGMFWAGVLATFAMAIGTAITVSALASLAVGSRELAARFAGSGGPWAGRIETAAGLAGSALVLILGASFLLASLSGPTPL